MPRLSREAPVMLVLCYPYFLFSVSFVPPRVVDQQRTGRSASSSFWREGRLLTGKIIFPDESHTNSQPGEEESNAECLTVQKPFEGGVKRRVLVVENKGDEAAQQRQKHGASVELLGRRRDGMERPAFSSLLRRWGRQPGPRYLQLSLILHLQHDAHAVLEPGPAPDVAQPEASAPQRLFDRLVRHALTVRRGRHRPQQIPQGGVPAQREQAHQAGHTPRVRRHTGPPRA